VFIGSLTGCSGVSSSSNANTGPHQFTHVYVVSPPAAGDPNNSHFMSTVMNQAAIEGVTVGTSWIDVETGTPGPGICGPVGTDICQQDAFGWTHAYNWSTVDSGNAQWFAAPGAKKVNIILDGIGGAASNCLLDNTCVNAITPYYVTTSAWATQTMSNTQDVINANMIGCTNYVGLIATSMTSNGAGLVTVNEPNHGYSDGRLIWVGGASPASYNIGQENVTGVQVAGGVLTVTASNSLPVGTQVNFENVANATFLNGQTVTITSALPTQFTAATTDANYGPAGETAGTANPLGVPVQNATTDSFQYQTAVPVARSNRGPFLMKRLTKRRGRRLSRRQSSTSTIRRMFRRFRTCAWGARQEEKRIRFAYRTWRNCCRRILTQCRDGSSTTPTSTNSCRRRTRRCRLSIR
jgi:hypothetical protein